MVGKSGKKLSEAKQKYKFLKSLGSMKKSQLNKVLPYISAEGYDHVCECVFNLLMNGNMPNQAKLKKLFGKHKSDLRYLANDKIKIKDKQARLKRKGAGFILPILAATLPILFQTLLKK